MNKTIQKANVSDYTVFEKNIFVIIKDDYKNYFTETPFSTVP